MVDVAAHEADQVDRANASGKTPVVFVHGLWLLPNSWDRWGGVFEDAGFTTLAPGWPDDPDTVEAANEHPEVFAHKTVGQIADHFEDVIGKLTKRPAIIGHRVRVLLSSKPRPRTSTRGEAKVKSKNPDRGPLLIMDGEKDNTVPWKIAHASYKKQKRNKGVTEFVEMPDRGHSLTIDHGWREVADTALAFIRRLVKP